MAQHNKADRLEKLPQLPQYLCNREELVRNATDLLRNRGVIVLRAPPNTGKTTLLHLISKYITSNHVDLTPVYCLWAPRTKAEITRHTYGFKQQLLDALDSQNPSEDEWERAVFLIDEAQYTYEEHHMWDEYFKNPREGTGPRFVLVCVHGSAEGLVEYGDLPSSSTRISAEKRIELYPNESGGQKILLSQPEILQIVQMWCSQRKYSFDSEVVDYFEFETQGHAGVLGLLLDHLTRKANDLPLKERASLKWKPELCHRLENDGFLEQLENSRGFWTRNMEVSFRRLIEREKNKETRYRNLTINDVKDSLRKILDRPQGFAIMAGEDDLALDYCHQLGLIHTQERNEQIYYTFASRVHQSVAFRRLYTGPVPGPVPDIRTLEEVCIAAIQRFSPCNLQSRHEGPNDQWSIPEATFQDELYRCIFKELCGCLIYSEYMHDRGGRVDFLIPGKQWGIELLQNGRIKNIVEHSERFGPSGKYSKWGIIQEYIIINFCHTETHYDLRDTSLQDNSELFRRTLQIVYDPRNEEMRIYNANHTLHENGILNLSEGD